MLTPSILKFLTVTLTALTFWAIDADAVSFFVDAHITDYMHIAQKLKQFLNIVLTKFCAMLCIKREENSVERVACVSGAILRVESNRVNNYYTLC